MLCSFMYAFRCWFILLSYYKDLIFAFSFSCITRFAWTSSQCTDEFQDFKNRIKSPTFSLDECFYGYSSENDGSAQPLAKRQGVVVYDHR